MKKTIKKEPKYSFGNDFEALVFSKKRNKIVNAIDLLQHGKENPIDLGGDTHLYFDNVLLEVSSAPYYSKEEMLRRFSEVFTKVQNYIGKDYSLVFKAGYMFDDEEVQSEEAKVVGCTSSYDAYNLSLVEPSPFENNFRTTGGHWHLGSAELQKFNSRINAIKLMDIFVGCANVIAISDESEIARRLKYGASGNHRCPPHGAEYRVLSSAFLNSKPLTELTFDLLNHSLSHLDNGTDKQVFKSVDTNMVREAIDRCRKDLAIKVLLAAKTPEPLLERIHKDYSKDNFYSSWGIKTD